MEPSLTDILKNHFGFSAFRPLQLDIIKAAMEGNDVLALMPTGGGKSLCYQVPGLAKEGLCLVISPLIALMNDQVQNLRKKNITAFAIHTGMSRKEVISVLETACHSNCKFLYVSPERLETSLFKEYLPALDVNFIAVDEAHCISQWGYDFRPPYLRIIQLRDELPGVPVIALTASATPQVQQDICEKLSAEEQNRFLIFRQSFERPNLSYSVFKVPSRINKIIEILSNVQGSAIVYCKTRKRTREIADLLKLRGIDAGYYHAGLSAEERTKKQGEWISNQTRVIVCTNAFGMGIDKPDVRVVIHADVPDSLENYYQEAGRAGRDGKRAFAVLLYDDPEMRVLDQLPGVRYPSEEVVKNVYRSMVHYLQMPEGEAPGEYYDFDLKDFIKKFGLDIHSAIYGLKALEQDGWLSFSEQIFIPSTVRFILYKDELYEYERMYPVYEPLIKTLLRTYEGIYDYPVGVSEGFLAHLLQYDPVTVKEQLLKLHHDRVIDYKPQKDMPQIMLSRTRVHTSLLAINNETYAERKRIFIERIGKLKAYISNESACRAKMIGAYFGDNEIVDCGICDNCLRKRKSHLSKTTYNAITEQLRATLQTPVTTLHVFRQVQGYNREDIWAVINFLIDEGSIHLQPDGKISWK